ncbi:MAG TPA: AAA family ATPase [Gammaproteobacteria bacterium]|nr:AAA family ATPase [Gammaproteobacteria bacterium]
MSKIITFFNHKGGVGKTTLVHNLGFILADKGYRVLLIDADPQMNLTAAIYGLSTSVEYSTDEDSKWSKNVEKYISLFEYINAELKSQPTSKDIYRIDSKSQGGGFTDLISGSINLTNIEADLYGIIKNRNEFTSEIPYKFEQAIKKDKNNYDFILIDTSPSASSIINALIMMLTDYFITPVSPAFFSLQAIDNLSSIFNNWIKLLGEYQTTQHFKGLSFKPKFLGLVIQMAKRFNGGIVQETTKFSKSAEKWIEDVNGSVKRFQQFLMQRGMSISAEEFESFFGNDPGPFIIQKCCDFTPQLRSIAEKAGIPVVQLTQEICNRHKDSGTSVDITKEDGQYARSFTSISRSYNKIADGLAKLL